MTTVTVYTVQSHQVELADAFTASRQPGGHGPAHSLGDGYVLRGMRQMPLGDVRRCADGSYIVLGAELRELLEEPIIEAERRRFAGAAGRAEFGPVVAQIVAGAAPRMIIQAPMKKPGLAGLCCFRDYVLDGGMAASMAR